MTVKATASQTNGTQNLHGMQLWIRVLAAPILMAGLIFVSAGRLDYWQGWVFISLNMAVLVVTALLLRKSPELVNERLKPGAGTKGWDKWYFALSVPLFIAFLIVSSLDAGRFGWTGPLPPWVYVGSIVLYVVGQSIFLWAKLANPYFSSVVRIQTERGQTVCRTGPYHYLRHPGYAGSLLWILVGPLVMGSMWGLIPAVLSALLLVVRTRLEDETLKKELPGYSDFSDEVKFRLVPGVW
jgi:protein-S-isoprenylcysteine O-methyltransferase Ste14